MKKTTHYKLFFVLVILAALAGCKTSKTEEIEIPKEPIDTSSVKNIEAYVSGSVPPADLEVLENTQNLPASLVQTKIEKINVISPSVMNWHPSEEFLDVYVFDTKKNSYVCGIKNCYMQSICQARWNIGTFWQAWSTDNAVYLIDISRYTIHDEKGIQYIGGYLKKTTLENLYINNGELSWTPEGDTSDYYLYSKKENRIIACVKDCWRQGFWYGVKGWGCIKNAYSLVTKDGTQYFAEASDYVICNEEGYEYINGWLTKTDFPKIYRDCSTQTWEPKGDLQDYYLYSKKQKQIVTTLKDCYIQGFWLGVKGWGNDVQNAYNFFTADGKRYFVESSDYIVQEKIDDEIIDAMSPDIKVSASTNKPEAGKKITLTVTGIKNKYLYIYGYTEDKKNFTTLKLLEGDDTRKTTFYVPFSVDRIGVSYSNQKDRWMGQYYESEPITKPEKDGRVFNIPSSYEKANQYRYAAADYKIVELANAPELEELRLSNQDAYLDEIIKRINAMKLDNFGKVTAIHDFISNLVCYDHNAVYEMYEYVDENGKIQTADRAKEKSEAKTEYKDVVLYRKTSCSGYSNLFYEMCCRADIVCEILGGYARGYLWKPDDDITKTNHAWNAVMLDGAWYLIDNTWDAGSENNGVRQVRCEHTWLFAQPEQFIASHFPVNPELQMIKNPVSAEEFKETPYSYPK